MTRRPDVRAMHAELRRLRDDVRRARVVHDRRNARLQEHVERMRHAGIAVAESSRSTG